MRIRVGIEIMRIDLESNQAESGQGRRLDNRHIVGCPNRRASHIGTGAASHVRRSFRDSLSDAIQQIVLIKRLEQPEAVSPAHENSLGRFYRCFLLVAPSSESSS